MAYRWPSCRLPAANRGIGFGRRLRADVHPRARQIAGITVYPRGNVAAAEGVPAQRDLAGQDIHHGRALPAEWSVQDHRVADLQPGQPVGTGAGGFKFAHIKSSSLFVGFLPVHVIA